ncbi:MAG: zinc ribbon domain-containing protein [Woeseia sp.]
MPIYEYACKKCQHTLDALQKMNDEPLLECPECGEPELRRLISAPRFRLKGAGWYETDFKKDNQRNVHKSDDDTPKKDKADSKSEVKSESRSENKSENKSESTSSGSNEKSEKKESNKSSDASKPAAATKKDNKADAG